MPAAWGMWARNAPSQWEWGYAASVPHLMVMFFAEPGRLHTLVRDAKGSAWDAAFEEQRWLGTADLGGIEPFGFADGISQPQIDWGRQRDVTRPQLDYSNVVALGEFLLGYPNEYDKYTDRPLLDTDGAAREGSAPCRRCSGEKGSRPQWNVSGDAAAAAGCPRVSGSSSIARPVEIARQAEKLAQRSWAARGPAIRCCRCSSNRFPASARSPDEIRQNQFTFATIRGAGLPVRRACAPRESAQHRLPRTPDRAREAHHHAGLRSAGLPRRPDVPGALSSHPAPRPRIRARAAARGRARPGTAGRSGNAACISSASTPTSRGSSSSCRMRGPEHQVLRG